MMSSSRKIIPLVAAALMASGVVLAPTASAMASAPADTVPLELEASERVIAGSARGSTPDDGQGPHFYRGVSIDVSGEVEGDVYASGQSVTISGDVSGDVIAAAQSIEITGTVEGNVRLAAQDVSISGDVMRSATVFAPDLTLADAGSLGDDLVAAAGSITLDGEVGRDLVAAVEGLTIDGVVGGDVTYYSDRDATIAEGAVAGELERIAPIPAPELEPSPWALFIGWFLGLLYALVALSLITLLAGLLLPRRLTEVTDQLRNAPWKALLVGFVASIAVPAVLVALLITIIGAPLALAGLLVWLLMTLATFVYGSHVIGRLVFRDSQRPVVMALVGGAILIFALHIPWLNILVWLGMVFFGLGAQLLAFHDRRPWRARPHAGGGPSGTPSPAGSAADPYAEPPADSLGEQPGERGVR